MKNPQHGARIVLEREGDRYRVTIYEPSAEHTTLATPAEKPLFDAWPSAPPSWAITFVERTLKLLHKKHAADASWPRKITRWREE